MNVLRITALLFTGILLFTGCGSKAEAVNPDASATQKEAPDADGADAAFSNNEITAVEAICPEAVGEGMEADAFLTGDAYLEWLQNYLEKTDVSVNQQDGMDQYYESVLKELLGKKSDENAVCSPLNIYVALSMLAEATDGNTRKQILDVLQAEDVEQLRNRIQALWDANYVDTPALKILLVNSMWLRNDISYREESLKRLAGEYHSSSYRGVMGSDEMNELLRKWTDEHTGGLLSEYTKDMELSPETVLALVSTIYYKAAWADQFQKELTNTEIFHGTSGDRQVSMMHMDQMMSFYQADRFEAVSLGLNDSGMMYFFLPVEGTDVKEIVASPDVIRIIRRPDETDCSYPIVHLSVPKFKVSEKTDLVDHLILLGITDVMDADVADFTPLTDEVKKIRLNGAEHAAMVEIDEDGVTGAAYTALLTEGAAMLKAEEVDFVLDRPFYFAVTAKDNSILFAGIVQTVE